MQFIYTSLPSVSLTSDMKPKPYRTMEDSNFRTPFLPELSKSLKGTCWNYKLTNEVITFFFTFYVFYFHIGLLLLTKQYLSLWSVVVSKVIRFSPFILNKFFHILSFPFLFFHINSLQLVYSCQSSAPCIAMCHLQYMGEYACLLHTSSYASPSSMGQEDNDNFVLWLSIISYDIRSIYQQHKCKHEDPWKYAK